MQIKSNQSVLTSTLAIAIYGMLAFMGALHCTHVVNCKALANAHGDF